jgi:tetratricopeptide (TPR) repeat protein
METALERNRQHTELLSTVAILAYETGEYRKARRHFQQLLAHASERAQTVGMLYLARLDRLSGQHQAALQKLERINEGPDLPSVWQEIGEILISRKGPDALARRFTEARQLYPRAGEALYQIEAGILAGAGLKPRAIDCLQQARQRYPSSPDLLIQGALTHRAHGEPEVAIMLLEQALALLPDNPDVLNTLGYVLLEENRLEQARPYLEKAVRLDPDNGTILDSLGWLEYKSGNTDRAVMLLETAWLGNRDTEIAAHLGEALWAAGYLPQAMKVWLQAAGRDPTNPEIKDVMRRFYAKARDN